jgi:hypothetical protein
MLLAGASAVALGFAFAALAFVEIHFKRSSLGCPYPIFVLTWHIIVIIPATIQVLLSRHKTEYESLPEVENASANTSETPEHSNNFLERGNIDALSTRTWLMQNSTSQTRQIARSPASIQVTLHQNHASAIQGGGDPWLIQLI